MSLTPLKFVWLHSLPTTLDSWRRGKYFDRFDWDATWHVTLHFGLPVARTVLRTTTAAYPMHVQAVVLVPWLFRVSGYAAFHVRSVEFHDGLGTITGSGR